MRRPPSGVLAAAFGLALCGTGVVSARDRLPWADANPLSSVGKPAGHHAKRHRPTPPPTEAPKADAAAAPTVPVPEERPAEGEGDQPAKPDVPPEIAKPAARPAAPDASGPDAPSTAAAPDPGKPEGSSPTTADPGAAAQRPVSEIPVPDARPETDPAKGETGKPTIPTDAAPPSAEDAPNAPEKLRARAPDVTPEAAVLAAAAVEDATTCEAELTKRGVRFSVGETISEGECGVLRPVELTKLSSGIAISPRTQILCRTALALDDWMSVSVVPAAKAGFPGDAIKEFRHASTYVCRPRASESGISEHARGSAIDIGGFVFDSGREIGIAAKDSGTPEATFLATVRNGACGPFKTVLGPGTDADHATHFHLDIAARSNGATYCK